MRLLAVLFLLLAINACHLLAGYTKYEFETGEPTADKIDILLVIDNSPGTIMADKQTLFEIAIRDLVTALLSKVDDLHIGVMTTSLGGHGSDACLGDEGNDRGHLVGSLVWDTSQDESVLLADLEAIVVGTGQSGCGFESTLESWYRFLVDPEPYESIELVEGVVVPQGIDDTVLEQRAQFLRPDSLVVVIVLTDENDCSIMDGGQAYLSAQILNPDDTAFHLVPARKACEIDPNDPCCTSCAVEPPPNCMPHPDECPTQAGDLVPLSPIDDALPLRCFDQKRRFGVDFLYDIDRYRDGLTQSSVSDRSGNIRPNPLVTTRDPSLIIYAGIVGVPWQDLARRASNGLPDLSNGLDGNGDRVGGLQTPLEMRLNGTWDVIVGNPFRYQEVDAQLPSDPLMIESIDPRAGQNPITLDPLVPPELGDGPDANPINGHEYTNTLRNDLQYACTFRLATPKVCQVGDLNCNCATGGNPDSPLCQDPATGDYGNTQYFVSAYPGIRHLRLLKAIGNRAVVGSICPAESADAAIPYGYQPTVGALLEAIEPKLR